MISESKRMKAELFDACERLDRAEAQRDELNVENDRLQATCAGLDSQNDTLAEEISALQSTIARLESRVAELESGRGELVAYTDMKELNRLNAVKSGYMSIIVYRDPGALVAPLYTAPPAPVAVVLPERDLLRDKIAEAIGGDTYDCTRVWSAWGVGTMDQNDFVSLVEQEDRLYEIVDACLDATAALNGVNK